MNQTNPYYSGGYTARTKEGEDLMTLKTPFGTMFLAEIEYDNGIDEKLDAKYVKLYYKLDTGSGILNSFQPDIEMVMYQNEVIIQNENLY